MLNKHGVAKRAVRSLKDATTWSRSDMAVLLKYYDVIAICCGLYLGLVLAQHAQARTKGNVCLRNTASRNALYDR